MRLYLDTNIIIGWFKRMMQSKRNGTEVEVPSVINFLTSHPDLELMISNLTRIEIFRYLKSEWACNPELSKEIWNTFLNSFNLEYIEAQIDSDSIDELSMLCLNTVTKKRTLTNLIHLQVAKKYKLLFLTGESELKEKYSTYYKNIVTYKELRRKLS